METIMISGKAEHGKDTFATLLKHQLEQVGYSVKIDHLARGVKQMAKDIYNWDGNKDEGGRKLLQDIGDGMRDIDEDYWVRQLTFPYHFANEYLPSSNLQDILIIPDWRYPEESFFTGLHFHNTKIRIIRPGHISRLTQEQLEHKSETALDNYNSYDYIIENDGLLDNLNITAKNIALDYHSQ